MRGRWLWCEHVPTSRAVVADIRGGGCAGTVATKVGLGAMEVRAVLDGNDNGLGLVLGAGAAVAEVGPRAAVGGVGF